MWTCSLDRVKHEAIEVVKYSHRNVSNNHSGSCLLCWLLDSCLSAPNPLCIVLLVMLEVDLANISPLPVEGSVGTQQEEGTSLPDSNVPFLGLLLLEMVSCGVWDTLRCSIPSNILGSNFLTC